MADEKTGNSGYRVISSLFKKRKAPENIIDEMPVW